MVREVFMSKALLLFGLIVVTGCASKPKEPADICQSINPNPGMYMLSGPVSAEEGVQTGSFRTQIKDGRCELSAAVYIDSETMISDLMQRQNLSRSEAGRLAQSDEYHERMVELAAKSVKQLADRFPSDTMRFRYQYLPTKPIRPFTVTVEN